MPLLVTIVISEVGITTTQFPTLEDLVYLVCVVNANQFPQLSFPPIYLIPYSQPLLILPSSSSHKLGKFSRIDSLVKAMEGASSHKKEDEPEEVLKFRKLLQSKEKVAKLHFFLQDALGGSSATVWEVARSQITATSATSFGQVRVLDDLITAEPDRNSEKLGRAQGVITYSGLEESALTMNLNFYFTSGEYSGSSLCIVGRNPISNKNRELPVVGGTGVFRMARGYSISNTYSYDTATNYGVLEYTVYVAYVDDQDRI